jgi:hypothetical protein
MGQNHDDTSSFDINYLAEEEINSFKIISDPDWQLISERNPDPDLEHLW